jgi:hypothetical protein
MAQLTRLWVLEAKSMSLRMFWEVKSCSKAVLAFSGAYGKSPCFSRCSVSAVVGVDYALLVLASLNVEENVECAF